MIITLHKMLQLAQFLEFKASPGSRRKLPGVRIGPDEGTTKNILEHDLYTSVKVFADNQLYPSPKELVIVYGRRGTKSE